MNILVTGAGGFVGQHLVRYLASVQTTAKITGTTRHITPDLPEQADYVEIDLLDNVATNHLVETTQPDVIYHLAAQSSPALARGASWHTIETNVRLQLNLFEACVAHDLTPKLIVITSANVYEVNSTTTMPITEDMPLCPTNAYALSKITQDMMARQYYYQNGLPIVRVRPFNHTGPGQSPNFVASDFAQQIANIEAKLQDPVMYVGNLEAQRDFTDVRDVVKAYALLAQDGVAGDVYNVSSNQAYSIHDLLHTLLNFTEVDIDVQVDPNKLRPVDVPIIFGSYDKLHQLTHWQPAIPFEKTLLDLLNDYRQRINQ